MGFKIVTFFLLLILGNLEPFVLAEFGFDGSNAGCGRFVYWVRGGYYVDNNDLVEGGHELGTYGRGFPFYICRVQHNGNTFIGKFIKSEGETETTPSQCWFSDGISDIVRDRPADYEVLVDHAPQRYKSLGWIEPQEYGDGMEAGAPLDAFWAGQSEDGKSLYIGQCTIIVDEGATVIPGMVTGGSSNFMRVAFNNESPACSVDKYLTCLTMAVN